MSVKVTEYNIHSFAILWKMSTSISHSTHFYTSFHRFQDINVYKVDFENLGQGHGEQHVQ